MISKVPHVFKLMRVHQAIKNLFIFLPLFFAGQIIAHELLHLAFLAFVAFSLAASAVYIFNDMQDVVEDRMHPIKKNRPIAAGLISKRSAMIIMLLLAIFALSLMYSISVNAVLILLSYMMLNVAYSLYLKKIAILDVLIIAIGFVLRLYVGSVVTAVPLSVWIVVMTFLLALFIALAKRRDDVIIYQNTGKQLRSAITAYNLKFLDASLVMIAAVTIVTYLLYTVSPEITARLTNNYLYLSTIFVISGLLRYLQITFVEQNSGSPIKLVFTDRFLQIIILLWLAFFTWVLYR